MSTVLVQARVTTEDLVAAIEQLEPNQVERVVSRLLHLQARRRALNVSDREVDLLREIFQEKRAGFQERFDVLSAKNRKFTLSSNEREEFLTLVDESEAFSVRRLEAMGELAELRQKTVPELMKQLGLKAPTVV